VVLRALRRENVEGHKVNDLSDSAIKDRNLYIGPRFYRKKMGLATEATATACTGEQETPASADSAVSQSLKLLAEIQAAIRAGDVKTIRRTADALRSSITSVLAKEAFLAASTLENTVHEDDLANAQDACRRLREALASLHPPTEELP
jgi:hypothetical protein